MWKAKASAFLYTFTKIKGKKKRKWYHWKLPHIMWSDWWTISFLIHRNVSNHHFHCCKNQLHQLLSPVLLSHNVIYMFYVLYCSQKWTFKNSSTNSSFISKSTTIAKGRIVISIGLEKPVTDEYRTDLIPRQSVHIQYTQDYKTNFWLYSAYLVMGVLEHIYLAQDKLVRGRIQWREKII